MLYGLRSHTLLNISLPPETKPVLHPIVQVQSCQSQVDGVGTRNDTPKPNLKILHSDKLYLKAMELGWTEIT